MKYQQRPILGVTSPRVQRSQGTEPQPALSHFYLLLGYIQPQAFTSSLRRRTLFEASLERPQQDHSTKGQVGTAAHLVAMAAAPPAQVGAPPLPSVPTAREVWARDKGPTSPTATECQSLRHGDHEKALGSEFSPDDSSRFLVHMSHLSVLPNCLVWPTSGPDTRCRRNGPF